MIEKLDLKQAVIILILLLFLIAPGVFVLFIFHRSIFIEIDTFKLVLLALSIVSPFFFVNLFTGNMLAELTAASDGLSDEKSNLLTLVSGVLITTITFYIAFILMQISNEDLFIFKTEMLFSNFMWNNFYITVFLLLLMLILNTFLLDYVKRKNNLHN